MSETYAVAARLRLPKEACTAYFRAAFPRASIVDPRAMFLDRKAKPIAWRAPRVKTIRAYFGELADALVDGRPGVLVVHHDAKTQSLWVYHLMIGLDPQAIAGTLLALAAACQHRTAARSDHAVVIAETAGVVHAKSILSVLEIGTGRAQFVRPPDVDAIAETLAPINKLAAAALARDATTALEQLHPQVRTACRRTVKAARVPLVLATVADALAKIRSVRVTQRATFERELMPLARAVAAHGAAIVPELQAVMKERIWERAVVAYWALNQISIETQDPRPFERALAIWKALPPSTTSRGWVRNGAAVDRVRALAAGKELVPALVTALDAAIIKEQDGITGESWDLFRELFDRGAISELLALQRKHYARVLRVDGFRRRDSRRDDLSRHHAANAADQARPLVGHRADRAHLRRLSRAIFVQVVGAHPPYLPRAHPRPAARAHRKLVGTRDRARSRVGDQRRDVII